MQALSGNAESAVIVRFLGTTPNSLDVISLLRSLSLQVIAIFDVKINAEMDHTIQNGTLLQISQVRCSLFDIEIFYHALIICIVVCRSLTKCFMPTVPLFGFFGSTVAKQQCSRPELAPVDTPSPRSLSRFRSSPKPRRYQGKWQRFPSST